MKARIIGPGFWEIDGFRVEKRKGRWGVYLSPNTEPVFESRTLKWCRQFIVDGLAHDARTFGAQKEEGPYAAISRLSSEDPR